MDVEYIVNHIPFLSGKRPGMKMNPYYITIHSTANLRSSALDERNWLVNTSNTRKASWHVAVDEHMAVEAIPLNEIAYHAGSGNGISFSIEICESGNREKTVQNAVKLVAKLLKERNWGVNKLKRHYDWSGKVCPRIFADNNWAGWEAFKMAVEKEIYSNQVKLCVDGVECTMEGFLKDGLNHFPIRTIADLLGYNVDWKDDIIVLTRRVNAETRDTLNTIKYKLNDVKIDVDKVVQLLGGE